METQTNAVAIYTQTQVDAITAEVAKAARAELGERLSGVILYGSYARGDHHAWSDIDVMILAKADDLETNTIKKRLTDKLWELVYETNLLLSILVVNTATFERYKSALPFYANVEKEGRRINA